MQGGYRIDSSNRFIEVANRLKEAGKLNYRRKDEGELFTELVARVPGGIETDRVAFRQGDAMNLPEDLGLFDVVLAANLIDRLADPSKFLSALPGLLKPGGQLVLTSPYTWLEEYTPRKNWLGGIERDGDVQTTLQGLLAVLSEDFVKVRELDLPFFDSGTRPEISMECGPGHDLDTQGALLAWISHVPSERRSSAGVGFELMRG